MALRSTRRICSISLTSIHNISYRSCRSANLALREGTIDNECENVKPYHQVPGPRSIPIFGTSYIYRNGMYEITKYHHALRDMYRKYGPIFRQNWAGQEVLHVFHLEDVKTVLHSGGKMPVVPPIQEGSRIYRLKKKHSVGLGNLNGDDWYEMRSVVQQVMLKPREVQHYLPKVDEISVHFIDRLLKDRNKGYVRDLHNLASKWFLENSGEILFEKRLGCLDGGEKEISAQKWIDSNRGIFYYNAVLKVATPMYKYIPTRPWKKLVAAEDHFYKTGGKHIEETILKIKALTDSKQLTEDRYNIIAYFLSKALNEKDIAFMCHSLISDGLSTVPSSIQYNVFCLAKNQDVQKKLQEEIDQFVPKEGPITVDILNNLSYLKAVVKETFRMFPLGTEVSRIIQKEMVLGGYLVPAGTVIDLNHSTQLQSDRYFPNAYKFMPERWMRGSDATENAFILTSFGHGTRMCVGRRFALQSLYVALARIIQKFELSCSPGEELGQVFNTLLFPDGPITVKFKER